MSIGICIFKVFSRARGTSAFKLFSASSVISRAMAYSVEERGSQYSLDYRVFLSK